MYYLTNYIYPDHLLNNGVDLDKYKHVNIFIDFRSNIPTFYNKELSVILTNDKGALKLCLRKSLNNILKYIDFHIKMFKEKNIDVSFIFFVDFGISRYHKNIYPEYKKNRKIMSGVYSKDHYSRMENNISYIIKSIFEIIKYIPNVYNLELSYIESDFVPHFLISNNIYPENYFNFDKQLNLILSTDKDMLQSLHLDNTYQIIKSNKSFIELYSNDNWSKYITKNLYDKLSSKFVPIILSIGGDKSDNIPGLKGIGYKTITKFIYKYMNDEKYSDISNFLNRLKNINYTSARDSKIAKNIIDNKLIIERNLKLISFDSIIDSLSARTKGILYNYNIKKEIYTKESFNEFVKTFIHKDAYFNNINHILSGE